MSESNPPEARSYHHGDLRRALVEAARRLVESEGSAAMSLRAVAREAGVSPAAPYHHFKDKSELMDAVAAEGWALLSAELFEASKKNPDDPLAAGVAYVLFARARPALYRTMYDSARDKASLPFFGLAEEGSPYAWVRETLDRGALEASSVNVQLEIAASWAATHGLAEMAGFKQFDELKAAMGGEAAFLRGVLEQMGLHQHKR